MADATSVGSPVLRMKLCGNPACRKVFTICISCDRGQRYCSPACNATVRRQQRKAANRRYQQSESGRDAHRRCQQRHRKRTTNPGLKERLASVQRAGVSWAISDILRSSIPGRTSSKYSLAETPSLLQDSTTDKIAATFGPDFTLLTCNQFFRPNAIA